MEYSPERHNPIIEEAEDSERLRTLYQVTSMLKQVEADGLDINLILLRILDLAVNQLNAAEGSIIVVNEAGQVEHIWLSDDKARDLLSNIFLQNILRTGVAGQVINSQQPLIINNTQDDEHWLPRPGHITSLEPWSVICVPFLVRNRAIGAITIHKPGFAQFDDHDLNLLTAISNQAASTIENARLFEQSQRQLQIAALLNEASRVINSSLDIDEIMHTLLAHMNEFLNAEAISIALVDNATNELVYQVAEGMGAQEIVGLRLPSNQGLSGWVMEHGEAALVSDTSRDSRFNRTGDEKTGYATHAMICAPMEFKGQVLGTIQAINPIAGVFSEQDLGLLVNLANIASTAIANAQQFARIQVAEARYTSLFQDSVDPIILTDLQGKIVEANQCTFSFLGYGRDTLLDLFIHDLHPNLGKLPQLSSISHNEPTIFQSELVNKEGAAIPVEVYVKRMEYGDNDLLQWIHHDISKQVELEQMRDDLTAMLFHDLQGPLGNIISSLELLSYELPEVEPGSSQYEMLDIARRSSQRLQALIRSLLDITHLEAGHPINEQKRVSIYSLIDDVYEVERPNFEQRRVKFVTKLDPDLPSVYVAEDMIRRVLINLVNNALKYSPGDKTITVMAQRADDDGHLLISVQDEGIGIPDEYKETIFLKFERVDRGDPSSKGLGLGLAFCRLAVEAHGGRIWVQDAPGGGALFQFTLPVAGDR
ncbi:MAG TPA: GAF domain-containing protein [Anaerolineae bacterium]|nr:GAF domain-containing protein [Anaerolineae bacterium]